MSTTLEDIPVGTAGPGYWEQLDDRIADVDSAMVIPVLASKFGGTGNGVDLENDAVEAARDEIAAATNPVLFFGRGTFALGTYVLFQDLTHLTIKGAGKRATTVKLAASLDDGIFLLRRCGDVTVQSLRFLGTDVSASDGLSGSAIYYDNTGATDTLTGLRVLDCEFEGFAGGGWLRVQESAGETIADIHIERNRFSGGADRAPTNIGVSAAQIRLTVSTATGKIRSWWIRDNVCEAGAVKQAIQISELSYGSGAELTRGWVENNEINDAGQDNAPTVVGAYAISLYGSGVSRVKVDGNEIDNPYTCGVYIIGAYRPRVVNNAVNGQVDVSDASLLRGGIVLAGVIKAICANNDLNDCGIGIAVSPNALGERTANIHHNDLSDCPVAVLIRPNADTGGLARGIQVNFNGITGASTYGIQIWKTASVIGQSIKDVSIIGNDIDSPGGVGIGFSAGAFFTGLTVSLNKVRTTGTHAYRIIAAAAGDIVGVTFTDNQAKGGTTAAYFGQYLTEAVISGNKSDGAGTAANANTGAWALPGCQGALSNNPITNLASGASRCVPLGDVSGVPDLGRAIPLWSAAPGTFVESWSPAAGGTEGWKRTTSDNWKTARAIAA